MKNQAQDELPETNEKDRQLILEQCKAWHPEVKSLLPNLPEGITIHFFNDFLIPHTGTGGFAYDVDAITISFDSDFKDRQKQMHELRGVYFHECFHLAQGFVSQILDKDPKLKPTALENAIYEGAATVFEREHAGTRPLWGEWSELENINNLTHQVAALPEEYDWRKWKFYDPETGNRWMLYRVGTYVTDQALKNNSDVAIQDLAAKSAKEIFELYSLS